MCSANQQLRTHCDFTAYVLKIPSHPSALSTQVEVWQMIRAKRHRESLSPTRGSCWKAGQRRKGAWCCHRSKPSPDLGCRSCGRSCTRPRPVDAAGIGIEWPRSPTLQTAVRRQDTPGQLPRPRFRALLGALSALHFGISAIGAEKLLSRMPGQHTIR